MFIRWQDPAVVQQKDTATYAYAPAPPERRPMTPFGSLSDRYPDVARTPTRLLIRRLERLTPAKPEHEAIIQELVMRARGSCEPVKDTPSIFYKTATRRGRNAA